MKWFYSFFICFAVLLLSCNEATDPNLIVKENVYKVPQGFPPIPYPANNELTESKVILGRFLFYEKLLSRDNDIPSCSHCMKQENAFCDNVQLSLGIDDLAEYRNTMSLTNSAYRKNLFWDGRGAAIESPAYRSIFLPQILGADTNVVNRRLREHPFYPALFKKAFGDDAIPSCYLASKAIASFVRTFVSGNSRYDQYLRGEKYILNASEKRGMNLFFSSRTSCSQCHSGFLFTNGNFHSTGIVTHYFDRGRWIVTGDNADRGKFITPTLRNIEVTAPYMHDGSVPTLEKVIEHYNRGGKAFINKDTLIRPLNLNSQEQKDLVAFLKTLTDHTFLNDRRFGNPHKN